MSRTETGLYMLLWLTVAGLGVCTSLGVWKEFNQPSCSEQCAASHATRIEAEGCVCVRIIEPPLRSCEEAWEKVDWAMNQLGLCKVEMMTRCGP